MPVIPPFIEISLTRIEQDVRVVMQSINVQTTNVRSVSNTVNNTNRTVNQIQRFDDRQLRQLSEQILSELEGVRGMVRSLDIEMRRRTQGISATLDQLSGNLEEAASSIESEVQNSTRQLEGRLNAVRARIEASITESRALTEAQIKVVEGEVITGVATREGLLIASRELAETTKVVLLAAIGGIATEVSSIVVITSNIEASVLYNRRVMQSEARRTRSEITSEVRNSEQRLVNNLTKLLTKGFKEVTTKLEGISKDLGDIKKELKKARKELPHKVAEQVSLEVVGESYYRFDSLSTYHPTLSFLFREVNVNVGPRRSQIKVRLANKNEEIEESDISKLRLECALLSELSYGYGTVRANYVSSDKRYKTTVFVDDASVVERVMTPICKVIGEGFESRNLSITTMRNRLNTSKRTRSLSDVKVNTVSYKTSIKVKLYKVVLLINGLPSPIVIYKKPLPEETNR